jgi:hypothetical protein
MMMELVESNEVVEIILKELQNLEIESRHTNNYMS